jgi:hypothetical protein
VAVDGPIDDREAPDEPPVPEAPQAHEALHHPDQPGLLKAVGELAAENADLYRKLGELTQAQKTDQARFGAWAREVARDREQAAQDKAQLAERLDKALAMNESLADRLTELEQKHADQSPVTSVGAPERRIGAEEGTARQTDRKHLRRLKVSNEVIAVGTLGVSTAATVVADVLGTAAAGDAVGIGGNALGLVAAVIALSRKRTEGKDEHRTQG